jgi:SAM-dependent methyltransferase
VLRWFRDLNVRASWATTPHQLWDTRGFAVYDWVARGLLGQPGTNRVVDVGGGRTWHFGDAYRSNPDWKLIGVDIDPGELALNPMLDEAITTDICDTLGVPDASADLVLCRAVVEHLRDTAAFLENVRAALRPGGRAVFVFANKWAPPMVLNRMIPHRVAEKLLLALVPGTAGYGGFRAHYDKCSHSAFRRELRRLNFEIEYDYSSYYSSSYFQFFLPIHFLSILLDLLRQALTIRNLSSMNLFVVRRPETELRPAAEIRQEPERALAA